MAEAMAGSILAAYRELGEKRTEYMEEYRKNCVTIGRNVEFGIEGKRLRGTAFSIDEEGALIIRLENGELYTLRFGEASVV
jgi:BirA family biotin operon repressor/biotin-[acetyl-CoA-carboxylase] ligase